MISYYCILNALLTNLNEELQGHCKGTIHMLLQLKIKDRKMKLIIGKKAEISHQ